MAEREADKIEAQNITGSLPQKMPWNTPIVANAPDADAQIKAAGEEAAALNRAYWIATEGTLGARRRAARLRVHRR